MPDPSTPRPTRTAERILSALAILSLVVPAVMLAAYAYGSYHAQLRDARTQLSHMVDVVHEHALRVFDTFDLVAGQVGDLTREMHAGSGPEQEQPIHERLAALTGSLPQVQDIWVIGADGRPLVTASIFPVPRSIDVSDRGYFRAQAEKDSGVYVSEVLRGRAQQSAIFFQLSWRRTSPAGGFDGVTAVSVQPSYFRDFYSQLALGGFDSASLVRHDGVVIARYPSEPADLVGRPRSDAFVEAAVASPQSGLYTTVSVFDGLERMIAYRRLPKHPVYVTAGMNLAQVRQAWRETVTHAALLAVPTALGLCLLSVLALRQTRREGAALTRLQDEAGRRQQAEDTLHQLQKMEAVGQLTGGVAHDFNNLLTVVVANLDRIQRSPDSTDKVRRLAAAALAAAARGEQLTQQLLAFARRQRLVPETADLNAMVRGLAPLIRRAVGEAVELRLALDPAVPLVTVDRTQFEASLLNLAVNARDATGSGGGTLTVQTRPKAAGQDAPGPDWAQIVVTDTGSGMPPEVLARVFEPFYTTKDVGKGSGLGLSQVYGFVSQSGGTIDIRSEPGKGTQILISLPPASGSLAEAEPPPASPGPAEPRGSGQTILVVEDDADVRAVAVEALGSLDYRVLVAADGLQALQILGSGQAIDLLFTDLVMPRGIDGEDLATRARTMRPGLPVLLTSGYAATQRGEDQRGVHFAMLRKPYRSDELARAVAHAMEGALRPEAASKEPVKEPVRPKVLVVEDEPLVLMSTVDMLGEAGFDVAGEAETAEAALAMLEHLPDISVVFSDVRLPGLSGEELASRIRSTRPEVSVVLTTGYAPPGITWSGDTRMLGKPFMLDDLEKLRAELALSVG